MIRLERLLSSVKDLETSQRGFLLTGEQPYLIPYEDARRSIGPELEALGGLDVDLPRLTTLVGERVSAAAATVAIASNTPSRVVGSSVSTAGRPGSAAATACGAPAGLPHNAANSRPKASVPPPSTATMLMRTKRGHRPMPDTMRRSSCCREGRRPARAAAPRCRR